MVEFTSSQQQFENKLNIADRSLGFVENTLGRIGASQKGPWPDQKQGRRREGSAGRFPTTPVAGGKGKVGEEIDEVDIYQLVGLDGVGGD